MEKTMEFTSYAAGQKERDIRYTFIHVEGAQWEQIIEVREYGKKEWQTDSVKAVSLEWVKSYIQLFTKLNFSKR